MMFTLFLVHFTAGFLLITGFLMSFFETKAHKEYGKGDLGWSLFGLYTFSLGVALLTI